MKHKITIEERVTSEFIPSASWECSCGAAQGTSLANGGDPSFGPTGIVHPSRTARALAHKAFNRHLTQTKREAKR